MTSGGAIGRPSWPETVATTMKIPSADSARRSRIATSSMSPTSTPSTNTTPLCSCLPKRAPRSSISSGRPLRPVEDRIRVDADRLGQLAVQVQPLVVAVDRHHVARLGEVQHQLELLRPAVPGRVHGRVLGRDHGGADLVEAVHRLVDRALVARDRRGREDDRVAGVQLHLRVLPMRHPAQRGQRLALAAGREHHEPLVGEALDLLGRHQQALGHLGVAELARDVEVLAHRAADHGDARSSATRHRSPAGAGGRWTRTT